MRLLFLANRSSAHASRWANQLQENGHQICFAYVIDGNQGLNKEIIAKKLKFSKPFGFLLNVFELKKLIRSFNPDIVHIHYAVGNGVLGILSGFKPLLTSLYGSDILIFPRKSRIHHFITSLILKNSTQVCSTSTVMMTEARNIVNNLPIEITPFGVDTSKFLPNQFREERNEKIVIGTIKKLATIYGIDTLIRSFELLLNDIDIVMYKDQLELLIVGDGDQRENLKSLVKELGLTTKVKFEGRIPHEKVPIYLNKIDVFCALSRSESFGVSVVEASSAGIPVVVSNVGGLPEVVDDGVTGYVVEKECPSQAKEALKKMVLDEKLRLEFGVKGREKVQNEFEWNNCVNKMEGIYKRYDIQG